MATIEDAITRFVYYVCAGLLIGGGAGLQWGFPCFLLAIGLVLLLWIVLVDIRVVLPAQWRTLNERRVQVFNGRPSQ